MTYKTQPLPPRPLILKYCKDLLQIHKGQLYRAMQIETWHEFCNQFVHVTGEHLAEFTTLLYNPPKAARWVEQAMKNNNQHIKLDAMNARNN